MFPGLAFADWHRFEAASVTYSRQASSRKHCSYTVSHCASNSMTSTTSVIWSLRASHVMARIATFLPSIADANSPNDSSPEARSIALTSRQAPALRTRKNQPCKPFILTV